MVRERDYVWWALLSIDAGLESFMAVVRRNQPAVGQRDVIVAWDARHVCRRVRLEHCAFTNTTAWGEQNSRNK